MKLRIREGSKQTLSISGRIRLFFIHLPYITSTIRYQLAVLLNSINDTHDMMPVATDMCDPCRPLIPLNTLYNARVIRATSKSR